MCPGKEHSWSTRGGTTQGSSLPLGNRYCLQRGDRPFSKFLLLTEVKGHVANLYSYKLRMALAFCQERGHISLNRKKQQDSCVRLSRASEDKATSFLWLLNPVLQNRHILDMLIAAKRAPCVMLHEKCDFEGNPNTWVQNHIYHFLGKNSQLQEQSKQGQNLWFSSRLGNSWFLALLCPIASTLLLRLFDPRIFNVLNCFVSNKIQAMQLQRS